MQKKSEIHKRVLLAANRAREFMRRNGAVRISIIYGFFGIMWILLSDMFLENIIPDAEQYKHYQTYKGWFYIFITTLMVYLLVRRGLVLLKKELVKTAAAYEKLQHAHEELMTTEAQLIYQKKLNDSIISEAPIFIIIHDEKKVISVNPYFRQVCGYHAGDLKEAAWVDRLVPKEYREALFRNFKNIRSRRRSCNFECPIITRNGDIINALWNSSLLQSPTDPEQTYFVSFGADINERKRYEEKVKHLAFYDSLTGLANRTMFENEINRYLNENKCSFMIAYIDIDNFKTINDSMGHQIGDLFLAYFADCLIAEVAEPNCAARLGGDEFAILFPAITREKLLEEIERLRDRVSKTWTIRNYQFYISMSIGVVCYPQDGRDSSMLMKNADIAMYEAKREGKNRILFYEKKIKDENFRHMQMLNDLQYGIEGEQFILYYQPQMNLQSGKITGVEALVRWLHPTDGFISPAEFIPMAEYSGQIYMLERWIVAEALKQKKRMEQMGFADIDMSINLSGKTLTSSVNFNEMEQIIAGAEVDFSRIIIEITETANISDVDIVIHHLNRLKALGIRVALDDFGTGYSSLNYLKQFPINIIKLDRSFIETIIENRVDTLLIKNILTLAQDLGFEVVAEGIETREQLEFLRKHNCGSGQGYLLSRPAPEEKIHELLKDGFTFEI
ncbi:diguanylate cyclase (GGDEF)-like protein/PAS domain S-box-containing protein [Anaerotaenia torta]|uniref:putative bifunctional diguanylate cyclase/phosphodiesterase n=1 Tax=Anaerotaenia torta TaxID=433293 RepID=UPI003D1E1DEF